jgi:hypothetical protein
MGHSMKHRHARAFTTALFGIAIAVSCASQEEGDNFSPSGSRGGSGGTGGKGGSSSTSGSGGTSSGGKGGTTGTGGNSTGGTSTGGNSSGGTSSGGTAGGGSGGGSAGDCSALTAGEGGSGAGVDVDSILHVEVKMNEANADSQPNQTFHIVNGTDAAVPLDMLTLRYYFTAEFDCTDTLEYSPTVNTCQLQDPYEAATCDVEVFAVGPNGSNCDAYMEFSVTAPADLASGQYAMLSFHTAPPNNDYSTNDQSNDASFGACGSAVVPWTSVTLFQDGQLVWGEEPYTGEGGAGGQGGQGGQDGQGGGGGAP